MLVVCRQSGLEVDTTHFNAPGRMTGPADSMTMHSGIVVDGADLEGLGDGHAVVDFGKDFDAIADLGNRLQVCSSILIVVLFLISFLIFLFSRLPSCRCTGLLWLSLRPPAARAPSSACGCPTCSSTAGTRTSSSHRWRMQ